MYIFSFIFLISSIPLLLAASISIRSKVSDLLKEIHVAHVSQGCVLIGVLQLIDFARILAVLVLPVPLGPQNRYA